MKRDLQKGIKLMRYSLSLKMNFGCMITFLVVGILLDIILCVQNYGEIMMLWQYVGVGSVLVICACMFPAQMIISLDVGTMVQASPYKKKLQTSLPSVYNGAFIGMAYILLVLIRVIIWMVNGNTELLHSFLPLGIFAAILIVYSMFVYKFFILSMVALYLIMFFSGMFAALLERIMLEMMEGNAVGVGGDAYISPVAAFLISLALIAAASFLHYLVTRLFYKRPLSRYAFGASMRRSAM